MKNHSHDVKSLSLGRFAILLAIFLKEKLRAHCGLAGDGEVCQVVKTVFSENGVCVPYRKQVVLTKNGENYNLHSTHKDKGVRSSEPRNRQK